MFVFIGGCVMSCTKLEDTYSEFTGDGPLQYLNKIYDLQGAPKWQAVLLSWNLKLDPGRTAILVEWTDDEGIHSKVIDKDDDSYLVEGLKNYEYTFRVSAIEEKDGEVARKSLGDPIYIRPYTYDSEELTLFTRVVNKQFKVAGKHLFVVFDPWVATLVSFKIGYFEKGNNVEQFWEAGSNDNVNGWPKGKPYALLGENMDFTKPVKVYRKGNIANVSETVLDLNPIELYFELPTFESDFAAELRERLDLLGEIKNSDIENVERLEMDYNQTSLADILHFPHLKELYLGKNRYIAPGTESVAKSSLTSREISLAALEVAKDVLGIKIYQYGKHYFDEAPAWFTTRNETAVLPSFSLLDTTGWTVSVTPVDAFGVNSGLPNLISNDKTSWQPMPSMKLRVHTIEIDLKKEESIVGFKIAQAEVSDANLKGPKKLDIEIESAAGQWESAAFSESVTLGTGRGEVTLVYLNKTKEPKRTRKVRFIVSDDFYKKGYDEAWNYVDFFNTTLSTFLPFN